MAESIAMKISGHKTRATIERCNIIDQVDLNSGVSKLNDKQKSNTLDFGHWL